MKTCLKTWTLVGLIALFSMPAAALDQKEVWCPAGVVASAFIALGTAATYYSYQEQDKNNPKTHNLCLASSIETPAAMVLGAISAGLGFRVLTHRTPETPTTRALFIAHQVIGWTAVGLYIASTVTSGLAYKAEDTYETVRAFALNLPSAVLSAGAMTLALF